MDKSKIYLDLSKCTEGEQKHIKTLTGIKKDSGRIYLSFSPIQNVWGYFDSIGIKNKTELTYPEFIKLFENGSLSLQTKLEMFYDFLYERGVAKQLGVGIDTIVKHFIDEKLLSNDR